MQAIRANQAIRTDLRIDSRQSGHLSSEPQPQTRFYQTFGHPFQTLPTQMLAAC